MSAHWTVYCADCDRYGPDIRRSARITLVGEMPRFHPDRYDDPAPGPDDAQAHWSDFLHEHEWHRLELRHE